VEANVPRTDDDEVAFARTGHDHKVDREREPTLDQLLGDRAALAAMGVKPSEGERP
jgi:hypothetical protein